MTDPCLNLLISSILTKNYWRGHLIGAIIRAGYKIFHHSHFPICQLILHKEGGISIRTVWEKTSRNWIPAYIIIYVWEKEIIICHHIQPPANLPNLGEVSTSNLLWAHPLGNSNSCDGANLVSSGCHSTLTLETGFLRRHYAATLLVNGCQYLLCSCIIIPVPFGQYYCVLHYVSCWCS